MSRDKCRVEFTRQIQLSRNTTDRRWYPARGILDCPMTNNHPNMPVVSVLFNGTVAETRQGDEIYLLSLLIFTCRGQCCDR